MIREIRVKNFKSIQKLKMDLGRVNVLIGENGSGKSNILEAVAIGSAASVNKLGNEFLSSRGIRVTEPKLMRSAFEKSSVDKDIYLYFGGEDGFFFERKLQNDNKPYSKWGMKGEGDYKNTPAVDEGLTSFIDLALYDLQRKSQFANFHRRA